MGIILKTQELNKISDLKSAEQKLVLVGGCFDILHVGHIEFLKKAKKEGDILIVLLESDEKIKKLKGKTRPINTQKTRGKILSNLPFVDYIICLPNFKNNNDYETLVKQIEPDIIALTAGEPVFEWEKDYVNETGGKIVEVIDRIKEHSTTELTQRVKI